MKMVNRFRYVRISTCGKRLVHVCMYLRMRVVYTSSLYCRLVLEDNRESGIRRSKQREREIEGGRERERERMRQYPKILSSLHKPSYRLIGR